MSRAKILIQGSLIRAGYGVAALAYPKAIATIAGLDEFDPNARYINRLLGGRDIILASSTILAAVRGKGGGAVQANILAETGDTAALVSEYRERGRLDRVLMIGLAFNAIGHLTWVRAALARVPEVLDEVVDELLDATTEQPPRRLKRPRISGGTRGKAGIPAAAAKLAPPEIDLDAAKKRARKQAKRAGKQAERMRKQAKVQAKEVRKQARSQADQVRKQAKAQTEQVREQATAQAEEVRKQARRARRRAKEALAA
jgi:hypothetical protein